MRGSASRQLRTISKASKSATLKKAVDYIQFLRAQNAELKLKNAHLARTLANSHNHKRKRF